MYGISIQGVGFLRSAEIARMVGACEYSDEQMKHLGAIEQIESRGCSYTNQDFDVLSAAHSFAVAGRKKITFDSSVTGTLDEMQPLLEAKGFTAVVSMAGPVPLAEMDPYGMRRVGSVNIQNETWAEHIYRGILAYCDGKAYLADAKRPSEGMLGGLFELV